MEASALLGESASILAGGHRDSASALKHLEHSRAQVARAIQYIAKAREALTDLAHWLDENRDWAYEEHLKSSGFRGSHFILPEYKLHLDCMADALAAAEERFPVAEAVGTGILDDFLKDFSPGVNFAFRRVCHCAIEMLTFQHSIAETRYAYLSYVARRAPGGG